MSLFTALLLASLLVLTALVASAYALRLSVQFYYAHQLPWPRMALITASVAGLLLIIWAGGLAVAALLVRIFIDPTRLESDPGVIEFVVRMTMLGLCLAAPWVCLKIWLRGSWPQAGQAALSAMILAVVVNSLVLFVVRRYVADTFQVRSGHMASTICGSTAELGCANCGRAYRIAYLPQRPPPSELPIACPNCRYNNSFAGRQGDSPADRFVVAKTQAPRRWDAIVLRAADDGATHIGRVVGLPNEQLEIQAGDLFVNGKRLQKLPAKQTDLWLPVHDTQYVPRKLSPLSPHWEPGEKESHWAAAEGQWQFAAGTATESLRFSGEIVDEIAYNFGEPLPESDLRIPVGDVRVQCTLGSFSGAGRLGFTWQFGPRQARASISARGDVLLENLGPPLLRDGVSVPMREQGVLRGGLHKALQLGFAVRDGAAYLTEGERTLAVLYVAPASLADEKQTPAAKDSCRLTLTAADCAGQLTQITVERDVYYRAVEEVPTSLRNLWRGNPTATFVLNTTSYCVLGDNSGRSNDSRFFGPVPRSGIVGVIRWIYWPLARGHELQ